MNPKELLEKLLQDRAQFWSERYPSYNREEKENYWVAEIYDSMRKKGEDTADEYNAFSKSWYDTVKGYEPDFDDILKSISSRIDSDFDWKKYQKRIQN